MISERFLISAKEKDMWQVYGYNLQHVKLKPTNNSNKAKIIIKFDWLTHCCGTQFPIIAQ